MKRIFATLTILTLISSLAKAEFETQVTEIARTVAQLSSVDAEIKSIKLNESGVMTVLKYDGSFKTLKLSQSNRNHILTAARELADVEVTTEQRQMVCEIMIPEFAIQNLSIINIETGKLRLVLSPSSCAFVTYTYPVEAYALEAAQEFKVQLITLARQAITTQEHSSLY